MISGVQKVLTPALEGSKPVVPLTVRDPVRDRPAPYSRNLSKSATDIVGPSNMYRGYYPMLPPIGHGPYGSFLPPEHYQVPSLMGRPRMNPYMGPPSIMPYWGGYSTMGRYHPGTKVIPVPIRVPRQIAPPPPPPIVMDRHMPPKKTVTRKIRSTFPRSYALARFRQAAYAVAFIEHLRALAKKAVKVDNRPNSMFLFGIILKEIVAALHRIYLNPSGNIYPVLNDIIGPNCYDLSALVHGGRMGDREESVLVQELQYVIENIIYHITEIMPSTGVLGTHRKSAVYELVKSGKRFPDGYFWQVELDRLQLTEGGRTANVGDAEGFMLMLGIFISRSLVTTLLMKPVDYGLSSQPLSEVAERNLRIVASALLYLVRRITVSKGRGVMDMPVEIGKYLYSDEEMQHVYGRLSRTFNYSEGLLREWCNEYIRRLRASSNET